MLVVEVADLVAPQAVEVVVDLRAGIVTDGLAGVAGLRDRFQTHQGLQGAMNGCPRDPGMVFFDSTVHLGRRGMIAALQYCSQNNPALDCTRYTLLQTQPLVLF